jgi:hypothetical protein
MPWKYINHSNTYLCGSFVTKAQRCTYHSTSSKLYQLYFGSPLGDQDKEWAPYYVEMDYVTAWTKGKMAMSFTITLIRLEPKNYVDDCCFCIVSVTGFSGKN